MTTSYLDSAPPPCSAGSRTALGLFIALGLVASAWLLADAARDVSAGQDKVQIKGYAEKVVKADLGQWTGQFSVRAGSLTAAYTELEATRAKVLAFLESQGYKDDQVSLSSANTIPRYKPLQNGGYSDEIIGYELTQTFSLRDTDVARLDAFSRNVTALIKEGVTIFSYPPQYYYTGLESLKLDLLSEATENARERAAALAKASGSEVGRLRSARQGVFQVTAYPSTDTSDYGIYDTSSVDKAVKAVVTVEFAIK